MKEESEVGGDEGEAEAGDGEVEESSWALWMLRRKARVRTTSVETVDSCEKVRGILGRDLSE